MALVLADRVQETSITTGTGSIRLDGAVGGYQSFAAIGNGNTTYYTITDSTQWEVGIGTYSTSGPTLSRDTVLSSSTGSKISFAVGPKNVFVTYPAEKAVTEDEISVDPRLYGAKADVWCFNNGVISAGSLNKITLGSSGWQLSAVTAGNAIIVRGAGSGGSDLITTIVSASGSTITMAASAAAAIADATGLFGTDDAPAINAAIVANGFATPYNLNPPPTKERDNSLDGWWMHGPARIVFKSLGRNNSLFGILSPIRLNNGCQIEWQTPVQALPGFSGQAMVHQLVNGSGQAQTVDYANLFTPYLLADGLANIGIWFERGAASNIIGQSSILGATLTGLKIGPDTQSDSLDRYLVFSSNGRILIENRAVVSGANGNDPSSIGVVITQFAYDNTFDGDVYVQNYRTGYSDSGGNNKVHGTLHVAPGPTSGYLTTCALLSGGSFYIERLYVDTPWAPAGTPTYGAVLQSPGAIGEIASTIATSIAVQDNQLTLINNQWSPYTGALGVAITSVYSASSGSIKFANVVAGYTNSLWIGNITTDGKYYNLGYQTEDVIRAAGDANLQTQITTINQVLPGAPWTPSQLTPTQMPVWLDASYTSSLALNGSNQVIQWASRTNTFQASVAPSSTAPTYGSTSFDGVRPGVTFNGADGGDMLYLGSSSLLGSAVTDVAVYMVVKKLTQPTGTTNPGTGPRTAALFTALNGSSTFIPEMQFIYNNATALQVQTAGGGTTTATGPGVNVNGILEGFFCTNYSMVGAIPPNNIACSTYVANTQSDSATTVAIFKSASTQVNFLGGDNFGSTRRGAFVIGEMIVLVNTAAGDTALRAKIEGYLAAKWWNSPTNILTTTSQYYLAPPQNPAALTTAVVTGFVQTTDKTVANTTSATSIVGTGSGTMTIPANTLIVGKSYRLDIGGTFGTTGTPGTLTLTPSLGGTSLGTAAITDLPGSVSNKGWQASFTFTCRTVGSSGTVVLSGNTTHDNATGLGGVFANPTGGSTTINTTTSQLFDVAATWATANASNIITSKTAVLVALN